MRDTSFSGALIMQRKNYRRGIDNEYMNKVEKIAEGPAREIRNIQSTILIT